ncbi:MAG: bifunctional 4-hydroxy-2-oxoglutarate aldolase/2-dehydro-3-deoxy-phosphogluconate aldolase, partial [Pseudomonadota bacterium]
CMAAVIKHVDGAVVGAGTVLTPNALTDCIETGCQFLVSPGANVELIEANRKKDVPLLPGVATPSEAMGLMAEGYRYLKFFPAQQAGGAPYLKSLSAVFPDLTFCPTGGLNANNAGDYLALSNVVCVGGSWVAPSDLIAAEDWAGITAIAQQASALA